METYLETIVYDIPDTIREESGADEKIRLWQLPKLLWAGTILFGVNLIVAASIAASSEMNVDIYGEPTSNAIGAGAKASPFAAPDEKPRPVRAAVKLVPIIEVNPEAVVLNGTSSSPIYPEQLNAREQERPAYVSGRQAIDIAERQSELTVPLVRTSTQAGPRSTSEGAIRRLVIN
jgi:hypothetical protein